MSDSIILLSEIAVVCVVVGFCLAAGMVSVFLLASHYDKSGT